MRRKLNSVSICLLLVLGTLISVDMGLEVVENAHGATIYVNDDGGADYTCIQDAIDAASDGDTIYVKSGVYFENLVVYKTLTIIGEDKNDTVINGGFSEDVINVCSDFSIISNFTFKNSGEITGNRNPIWWYDAGIELNHVNNCSIYNNLIINNKAGIFLNHSDENKVAGNVFSFNTQGVASVHSNNNIIDKNKVYMSLSYNLFIIHTCYTTISNNSLNNIPYNNISYTRGIELAYSKYNQINHNNVLNHWVGIHLFGYSDYNKFIGNNISNNNYGVYFNSPLNDFRKHDNILYLNNFISNGKQAYDMTGLNYWDIGYPIGGNYWSDYTGQDNYHGPDQNINGSDDIGDTHYEIDYNSIDHYPLMEPYTGMINKSVIPTSYQPIACAGADKTVFINEIVNFDGSNSYDPMGNIISYKWNFGDNSSNCTGINTAHIFKNTGKYIVTLIVTDSDGNIDMDICLVTVIKSVYADAGSDQKVYLGEQVQFNGNGSRDDKEKGWVIETVEHDNEIGNYNSIAVDSGDNPHISYYHFVPPPLPPDPPCGDPLKYASRIGESWEIQIVDNQSENIGLHTSLAIDSNDYPHICYYDETNALVKYARWNGISWDIETVDSEDYLSSTSICLDSNDFPHIIKIRRIGCGGHIKYIWWNGSNWNNEIVDPYVGFSTGTLSLDSFDNPHISYKDDNIIYYAKRNGSNWDKEVIETDLHGYQYIYYGGFDLDSSDHPHLAYFQRYHNQEHNYWTFELKYMKWDGNQWHSEIVDHDVKSVISSMVLDKNNNPHISYYEEDVYHKRIKYANLIDGNWKIDSVDKFDNGYFDLSNSIDIDSMIVPHISYRAGSDELRYATKIGVITYEWDFNDGSPNSTEENPTHIYSAPGVYNVTLTVTDKQGNSDTDTCKIIVIAPSFQTFLEEGWNLISIPLNQTGSDLELILKSIEGEYDVLQWYDASDSCDPWKHYHVSKPSHLNDLSEINYQMGIWIHITKEGGTTLYLEGDRPTTSRFINLYSGWNLVGYSDKTNRLRNEALRNLTNRADVDLIQTYNSETQKWEEIGENDYLEVGKGYWVHAKTDCIWEVPL
ncbi:MAG: PKD domain-containing protein [Thermoplasmata archaeon]|nr:MAG: PKD domain-containing protein [Thermoplasmata archaeon]